MSNERKKYESAQEIPISEVVTLFGIPFETQDELIYAADCIINTETNTFWDGSETEGDVIEFTSLALSCCRSMAEKYLEEKYVTPESAQRQSSEVQVFN